MPYRLDEPRAVSPDVDTIPPLDDSRRVAVEALLLRALEPLHPHPLTAEQHQDMAQALSEQTAATARLRRFALGNDDAPYFMPVSVAACRDA